MAKPQPLDGYSDQYTIDRDRVLVTRVAPVSGAALGLPAELGDIGAWLRKILTACVT